MMQPHFFGLSSRLGMHRPAWKATELNIGVEDAPAVILTPPFLDEFAGSNFDSYLYKSVQDVSPELIPDVIADETLNVSEMMQKALRSDEMIVSVGGDHTVSLAPFHAVLATHGAEHVGVLRIDSHPDIHLASTSQTGNVHGMWMRIFVDQFDLPRLDALAAHKLGSNQYCYIGNLDSEAEERRFLNEHHVNVYDLPMVRAASYRQDILAWCRGFKHLIVDIDVDAFDSTIAPGTGIPAEQGLLVEDVEFLFGHLSNLCALQVVEVNPRRDDGQTVALAQHLMRKVLKAQVA